LTRGKALLADWGYDADWFRVDLIERGITPCIPSKVNRWVPAPTTPSSFASATLTTIRSAKLKDWRCIHTCYYRCAHIFMSAVCIGTIVIFWLDK
jgi:hypothetical protein